MGQSTKLNKPGAMRDPPQPPSNMSLEGQRVWRDTLAVRPASEWSIADTVLLGMYVQAVLDVARLNADIERFGDISNTKSGLVVVSPLVLVRAKRERTLLDCASRLRITPSARYTARRVGELARHASKALAAEQTAEADDLLAGPTRRHLQ